MTPCEIILLGFLALFTAVELVGFWVIVKGDREGFWESILPVVVIIGVVVVSWAIVLITLAGRGEL